MELNQILRTLKILEEKSLKKGYRGDATSYAFKRHTLMLLSEIARKKRKRKRKLTAWNAFLSEYLKKGKTIKEAAEDWKKKKK